MAQSLDSVISNRLGIDNLLCPPLRSVSWWGLVVIVAVTIAEAIRHASAANHDTFVLAALSILILACYYLFRTRVARLMKLLSVDSDGPVTTLRSVSAAGLTIAGVALWACFYGIIR